MKNKLSLIKTMYNVEYCIGLTLRNFADFVRNNNSTIIEIVLVDNASSDSTISIVEKFIKDNKDIDIKLVKNKRNIGPGGSRYVGIKNSKFEYCCFVDADDFIFGTIEELEFNKDIIFLSSFFCLVEKDEVKKIKNFSSRRSSYPFGFIFNKKIIESYMFIENNLFGDWLYKSFINNKENNYKKWKRCSIGVCARTFNNVKSVTARESSQGKKEDSLKIFSYFYEKLSEKGKVSPLQKAELMNVACITIKHNINNKKIVKLVTKKTKRFFTFRSRIKIILYIISSYKIKKILTKINN